MRTLALTILAALLLAACGVKGPLYIPEKRYPPKAPVEQPQTPEPTQEQPQETR